MLHTYTEGEVLQRVIKLLKEGNTAFGILVQDYIIGRECSAIVVEMGRESRRVDTAPIRLPRRHSS
jgi:predicted ATP-grasp superfamily ATP-dependent carboligase